MAALSAATRRMDSCQAISILFNGGRAPGIEPGNLLCERMTVRQLRLKIKDPTGTLALKNLNRYANVVNKLSFAERIVNNKDATLKRSASSTHRASTFDAEITTATFANLLHLHQVRGKPYCPKKMG